MSFLSVFDYSRTEIDAIIDLAIDIKTHPRSYEQKLKRKSLACIFEKPSTRTRVSFELAIKGLGGFCTILNTGDSQLGRGESIADTARVMSRYVDAIMARVFNHKTLTELEDHSTIPIINGLSDIEHPCQIIGDLTTIKETKGFKDTHIAYVGDGNNVCNSLIAGCGLLNIPLTVSTPKKHTPDMGILETARSYNNCIDITENPKSAVNDVDIVYTDVWTSMGHEDEKEKRQIEFQPYQINQQLMDLAKKDALFMHCLPAYRGYEVTDEVLDGDNSIVWQQAENRLHAQKAILLHELDEGF